MKRILIICLLLLPFCVFATGGGLRKSSIKTCPNGVTYGLHSDGHGGTHWHVAVTNGDNYYADGAAIYSDPCPGYTKNQGTAGDTDGNYNNSSGGSSSTTNNNNSTNNYSNNNSGNNSNYSHNYSNNNNNYNQNKSNNSTYSSVSNNTVKEPVIQKSIDNSIKTVVIDNKDVSISDNMNFTTTKKNIDIDVKTNDSKAKVEVDKKELVLGENIVNIIVTAESGDKKNYTLTINRIKGKGTATIKKFTLNSIDVIFDANNKAVHEKLIEESSLDYSYELSDKNAKLIIYLNGEEVKKLNNIKENDKIKLVVVDSDQNELNYEIKILNHSLLYSFLINLFTILFFVFPIICIILFINRKKIFSSKKKII